jgi:hypothetical protein
MHRVTQRLGIVPTLFLSAGLVALGLLALNHIVNTMWPFDVTRLELVRATAQQRVDAAMLLAAADNDVIIAFLASIVCVVTGLSLPVVYFLNRRFNPHYRVDRPPFLMLIRQALWVGLWGAFCVWLQMNRTLGIAVAVLIAAVFILFELLLQIRTRASAVQQQVPQQQ